MSPLGLILVATFGLLGSGALAGALGRRAALAASIASFGAAASATVGLAGAVWALATGATGEVALSWSVPGGALVLGVDPLSAVFLVPVFAIGGLGALFGRAYLGARPMPAAQFSLLVAATALILLARHALPFLFAWELMTLLSFALITLEHGEAEVRRAGWIYLIAAHVSVLALFGLFVALGASAGGALDFASATAAARGSSTPAAPLAAVFALALVGFGLKAGVVGLHVWLPEAHAAAPSHVSAFMSAVTVKVGIYGLLRTALLVPPPPALGVVFMVLGAAGALVGVALALGQRDLKRVLAYSTVENLGLILLGVGLGLWAGARGDVRLAAFGLGGALLHVWNHAAAKGLLFFSAGSVVHGTGTRDLERLGGLLGRMPWTARAMLLGAVAIAGLPPLNGLAGEWLLYRGFASVGSVGPANSNLAGMCAAAALALTGGLAVLCFARLVGVALLGTPRHADAAAAHEGPPLLRAPMAALAVLCVGAALLSPALVRSLTPALGQLCGATSADVAAVAASLEPLASASLWLLAVAGAATAVLARRARGAPRTETWGCGYAAPTPRMQYTAASFSEYVVTRALPNWLRPRPRLAAPQGLFPKAARLELEHGDPLTSGAYEPFLSGLARRFGRARVLQQGSLHAYLVYILVALVIGLAWASFRSRAS